MGAERSIAKLAKVVGKPERLLKSWSGLHDWVLRAHQYDVHVDREQRQLQTKERLAMLIRHANAAVQVQKKALQALANVEPEDLTTADIVRWIDLAARLERTARGVPEEEDHQKAAYQTLWERLGGATGTDG